MSPQGRAAPLLICAGGLAQGLALVCFPAGERGLSAQSASYALAAFWAFVTIGGIIVAVLPKRIRPSLVYLLLPVLIAASNVAVVLVVVVARLVSTGQALPTSIFTAQPLQSSNS